MQHFFRAIRTLHSWMGFLILPWIVLYGFTGFYLNHAKTIDAYLVSSTFDESQFVIKQEEEWLSVEEAREKSDLFWPDEKIINAKAVQYHGFVAIRFDKPSGSIIVAVKTGHFYKKTRLYRYTFDPSGALVDRKFYWSFLFKYFHEVGWIDNSYGIWFADVTAIALVIFGVSGLFLFIFPRQRKIVRFIKSLAG